MMKIWLALPYLPTGQVIEVASAAEEAGAEGVALSDHACVPADPVSAYPYSGKRATFPDTAVFPDPLVLIGGLAIAAKRLRLMTNVLLVPLYQPVLLARQVATAAGLAPGRLDLGVGVGWMREEFDAVGMPFERRGARLDESLAALRKLWTGEFVEHHGDEVSFPPLAVRPAAPGRLPVLVGGRSPAALRRAARIGDGWLGVSMPLGELPGVIRQLSRERLLARSADRPFEVRTGLQGRVGPEVVEQAAALGVNAVVVELWQLAPPGTAAAGVTLDAVAPALRDLIAAARTM
jgi:probable F420-dependent oxidoreductase